MSDMVLEVKNLEKNFGELQVLKDVCLDVHEGEVISVIGSSGSGKTTLLRCITCLETIDSGAILVDGETLVSTEEQTDNSGKNTRHVVYAPKKQQQKLCAKTGLVFQNFNLFPHWNILRNITEAPVSAYGVSRQEAEEQAIELLKKLGLESKASA